MWATSPPITTERDEVRQSRFVETIQTARYGERVRIAASYVCDGPALAQKKGEPGAPRRFYIWYLGHQPPVNFSFDTRATRLRKLACCASKCEIYTADVLITVLASAVGRDSSGTEPGEEAIKLHGANLNAVV